MSPLALSFFVATIGAFFATIIGGSIGVMLARTESALGDFIDAIVAAPMVLPPTVLGYYLLVLLGARSPIGRAFESITGHPIVFTTTGAILAAAVSGMPFVIKATRASLLGIDRRYVDVARTLGATPWRALRTIELPLAARGITVGVVLGFARGLGDFGVTYMVAGSLPGTTRTASLAIYESLQAGQDGDARNLAIVLTVIAIGLLFAVNRLIARQAS